MGRVIPVYSDDFEFADDSILFDEGVTILVGPNGYGKSSLISRIKSELLMNNIEFIHYDETKEGRSLGLDYALNVKGDMSLLATMATSSEGQRIMLNSIRLSEWIHNWVDDHPEDEELWVLVDAIDSGLSIDNIRIFKGFIQYVMSDIKPKNCYMVIAANSYELTKGYSCLDVRNCQYGTFNSYDEYAKFIVDCADIIYTDDEGAMNEDSF